ncbi:hypothetical protein [Arthrobacter tumbae]|uniref:hypothetical protein n=1 Tax=Arthrobacter tumbae TaxID=163874 RepID=UPI001EF77A00|nr:hypothetical protein [Arthrobacter tumbae]MBM7781763.1 hypothetical protein [Arthrobacter tumbae]
MELDPDIRQSAFRFAHSLDPASGTSRVLIGADTGETALPFLGWSPSELAAAIVSLDLAHIGAGALNAALQRSVEAARYWQEPDGEDILAGLPEVREAFAPIADKILALPSMQWLREPRHIEQWAIDWRSADDPAPLPRAPRQALSKWAQDERAEELRASRDRPQDPHANWSGTWWSVPRGTISTVGQIPAGLSLIEDFLGWEQATVIAVRGIGATYEIRTADDWVALCRKYPLEVTASRRHDWFKTTGRNGRWVLPDWERVADEWDAVHLTGLGYLSSAGQALPVDSDTSSVIAGWDPDRTFWLTDVAREWETPRQAWHRPSPQEEAWTQLPK